MSNVQYLSAEEYQNRDRIVPQDGPQRMFCESPADVVWYGGAAYGGKSYCLLMESCRYAFDPNYTGIIFRRKSTEITTPGGLWDTAQQIYTAPNVRARLVEGKLTAHFPPGGKVKFSHLEHEKTKVDHHGGQYVFIGFDELVTFTRSQYFYLLTRNRPGPGCSLRPYVRATMNADADSWCAEIIQWWWDPETGYPIPERAGVIRYYTIIDDQLIWVDKDWRGPNGEIPKSFTFIPSNIDDNPLGQVADPTYKSNLYAQDMVTRERLLSGNWKISYSGGMFKPEWFDIVEHDDVPADIKWLRYWDFAATEPEAGKEPDFTVGGLLGFSESTGDYYIGDINRFRETPAVTEKKVRRTAEIDGNGVPVGIEQEKGSAGRFVTTHFISSVLRGYEVYADDVTGEKVERAKPWAALAERHRVHLVRGDWNRAFLLEAGSFPNKKRDQIDAISGAFKLLAGNNRVLFSYIPAEYGHKIPFKKDLKDFNDVDAALALVIIVMYRGEDGGLYGGFYLWSRKSKVLRIYNEIYQPQPVIDRIVGEMAVRAVVPIQPSEIATKLTVGKIFGNAEIFKGGFDLPKMLRARNIRIKENRMYDERGSIAAINQMFVDKQIRVHPDCTNTDIQIRTWAVEKGKPMPGFHLCRCLLIAVSELKAMKELEEEVVDTSYSYRKRKIREDLRKGEIQGAGPKKRDENDYLV
jgi:predicted phage terminase large subunit-like protein